MKRLCTAALVGAVGFVSACGSQRRCDAEGTGVSGVEGVLKRSDAPRYLIANEPARYLFTFPAQQTCDDTVTARLEREDGTLAAGTAVAERTSHYEGEVHLEVAESGVYRLQLTFEPGARVATTEVVVVEDRSGAFVEVPRWCTEFHVTEAGAALCDARIFRDGEQVDTLNEEPGTVWAVAGNAVWEDFEGTLRRFVDTGSGPLAQRPITGADAGCCASADLLHATPDDLLRVSVELQRFETATAALVQRGSAEYGQSVGNVKSFLGSKQLLRNDDGSLAFLVFQQAERSDSCVYALQNGQVTKVPWNGPAADQHNGCQLLPGSHVGASEGGIWVYDGKATTPQVRYLRPSGEGVVEVASFAVPRDVEVGPASGVNPGPPELRDGPHRILPRFQDGRIVFDLYVAPEGFEFRSSHAQAAAFISTTSPGSTRIHPR